MGKYLVDTTVVVEMLRGNIKARDFLQKERPEVSAVTAAELIQGSHNREDLVVVKKTLKLISQIQLNVAISELAIELLEKYRLSHGLMFLDALIAAMAIVKKKVLVTGNVKDFKFISGLKVVGHEVFEK